MKYLAVVVYFTILALSDCSTVPLKGRIIGGQNVDIANCSYQVSVRAFDKHICGGSIISRDTILTAAHCTDGKVEESLSIRHGSTYADYGTKHKVTKIIQNPDFNPDYNEDDSSLLKITPPIKFTRSSQPVKLAEKRSADNSEAVICGWGVYYEDEDTTGLGQRSLKAITVRVVNLQACQEDYHTTRINGKMMCAAANNVDSCQGDSGGGLIDTRKRQIIGISSWGEGCAKKGKPGIYASVPDMLKFIKTNMYVG